MSTVYSAIGEGQIGILGAPIAVGQGKAGVAKAPKDLRDAGLSDRLQSLGYKVTDYGNLQFEEFDADPVQWNMRNPKAVGDGNRKIADTVSRIISSGKTCMTLGGDHSLAIGSVFGHAQVHPNLGLIWVDAHADLNPPLASSSGNSHGMPVSFLLKELVEYIPKYDSFSWLTPCLTAKDIVYIGLRDVDTPEKYIIEKLGIRAYYMRDVDRLGIVRVMQETLEYLNPGQNRPLHLSFDVDGLDPSVTPSTGTPVPGGLTIREGMYLVEELALTNKLSGIDIVEVNPEIGTERERTITLNTSLEIASSCFRDRRLGDSPEKAWIPTTQKQMQKV